MSVDARLQALSLAEKAALLSGTRFMETNPVPRLGIPKLVMADGPHGLRKQIGGSDNGVSRSEPATAFPTAATIANSWDPEIARKMGEAIAEECRHYGVNLLLGPGVNIKRNPLCGRNFEYYSEDPLLSGAFGSAFVQGVQSRGVGATIKHFAANNAETYRFMGESVVDERALHEIYFPAFRHVVEEASPFAVMCAYNRLWGTYCSENRRLLTELLRDEWGFRGLTMTDWGATNDRAAGVAAGMDLEMPGDTAHCRKAILDAAESGTLPLSEIDGAVRRVLELIDKCGVTYPSSTPETAQGKPGDATPETTQRKSGDTKPVHGTGKDVFIDLEKHHVLASEIAKRSAVLLKNDGVLPLQHNKPGCVHANAPARPVFAAQVQDRKLLFVGDLFIKMRYQGSGSSMIHPTRVTTPQAAMDARGLRYRYAQGYEEAGQEPDGKLLKALQSEMDRADILVFFGGLTDAVESEGGDRADMRLPANQLAVIDRMGSSGKPLVVVLFGGSPVELPFVDKANAILNMGLPGQNGGEATAALLFGEANPCGKLTESWPIHYEDVPFGSAFSSGEIELYRESVFVGYRYYTTAHKPVRFPFGHGLSYTRFSYANPEVREQDGRMLVTCEVTNVGSREGSEVVQLYVQNAKSLVPKPLRELRAFQRVALKPGETGKATLSFERKDLAYYHPGLKAWVLENGIYGLQIGASSEDIRLVAPVEIAGELEVASPYVELVATAYRKWISPVQAADASTITDVVFEALLQRPIPQASPKKPLRMESILSDFHATWMGKILFSAILTMATRQRRLARRLPPGTERDNRLKGALFLERVLSTNSPRSLSMNAGTQMPYTVAQGLVALANGHPVEAVKCFLRKEKVPPLPRQE